MSPHYFPPSGPPVEPENESVPALLARRAVQGHYCCMCPLQDPPLPCCNAGHAEHAEAEATLAALTDSHPDLAEGGAS